MDYRALGDYHVHTRYSDGEGEIEDCIERAVALGLAEIGISDHLIPPGLGEAGSYGVAPSRLDGYVAAVREAAARHPEIRVLLGVEADYLPDCEQWLADTLSAYPFDYVIGGVHFVGRFAFDDESVAGHPGWPDVDAVYRAYYETVSRAAGCGLFDVMAHLDHITVWSKRPTRDVGAAEDAALEAVAAAGTAIELCTSGLCGKAGVMYPAARLLGRAHDLGVPLLIDSDAHEPGEVGMAFDRGVEAARLAGYRATLRLSDRSFVPLP
jgi:histidinol-phosphatase (PHP family)